jgi:hypothetical protein
MMDPDANLKEQLRLAERLLSEETPDNDDVTRLAELVVALDDWLAGGGFLPKGWKR